MVVLECIYEIIKYQCLTEIIFFVITPYNSLVSDYEKTDESGKPLSPVTRLYRLLRTEKKDIVYILFYSLIIGLITMKDLFMKVKRIILMKYGLVI